MVCCCCCLSAKTNLGSLRFRCIRKAWKGFSHWFMRETGIFQPLLGGLTWILNQHSCYNLFTPWKRTHNKVSTSVSFWASSLKLLHRFSPLASPGGWHFCYFSDSTEQTGMIWYSPLWCWGLVAAPSKGVEISRGLVHKRWENRVRYGQAAWCSISSDVGVAADRCGDEGADLKPYVVMSSRNKFPS